MRIAPRSVGLAAAVVGLVAATGLTAGIAPSPFRPASLVADNLVMHGGKPFVRLADLARALGGTMRYDPAKLRYEIQPGTNGALLLNPGLLPAHGPDGDPERPGRGGAASRLAFKLGMGGQDVMIDEEDEILLRPGDPAVALDFVARLLGGRARLDAGKGAWLLPPGGPGSPLRFR